jgi:hypothetical protein
MEHITNVVPPPRLHPWEMRLTRIIELGRVALKEEKWLEVVPDLRVCPMFAEDIGRVENAFKVMHLDELGGNGLTNTMKRQCIMALVQLCMRDSRTVYNRLVVAKDVALVTKRDAEVTQGGTEVNNLIDTSASRNKLRTIGSGLNRSLFL